MVAGKQSKSRKLFLIINAILLIALAWVTLYPFLYVAAASFSDKLFIMQGKIGIIPIGFTTQAYESVFTYPNLWQSYGNTIFYMTAGTAINMVMTVFGAYALSRRQLLVRTFFTFFIVFTMWVNAGMIPTFLVVRDLGMYDSIWAILLPGAISTYNLVVMRTFFTSIPVSLEEAAKIDGCNDMQALLKIILPLSIPSLVTIGLFYMVAHWNSFMPALIYLRSKERFPLQLILREIIMQNAMQDMLYSNDNVISESIKYATIIVATLPILCVYPFIQKYFVKGVMIGAVKE